MTRYLFAMLIVLSGPVMAKDDGGFGSQRFTSQAPAALGGPQTVKNNAFAQKIDPSAVTDIEPAAGEDASPEDKNLSVEKSKYQPEPYIIKKDLEIR